MCMHVRAWVYCICVRGYIVCMHVGYIRLYMCMYEYVCVFMDICVCMCMRVHMSMCVRACVCVSI